MQNRIDRQRKEKRQTGIRSWWVLKAVVQSALSLLPFGEQMNHILQKLYKYRRFSNIDKALESGMRMVEKTSSLLSVPISDMKVMEIGTGWQPTIPIFLSLIGVREIYTIDPVCHLRLSMLKLALQAFRDKTRFISSRFGVPEYVIEKKIRIAYESFEMSTALEKLGIVYLAPRSAWSTGLPENYFDLVYSSKVLEHVPVEELPRIADEAMHILRPGGLFYNDIGMIDHFYYFDQSISPVQFLKYPEWLWRIIGKNKISYQNRCRNSDYLKFIRSSGFQLLYKHSQPDIRALRDIKEMKVAPMFREKTVEDMAVLFTVLIGRKPFKDISLQNGIANGS